MRECVHGTGLSSHTDVLALEHACFKYISFVLSTVYRTKLKARSQRMNTGLNSNDACC